MNNTQHTPRNWLPCGNGTLAHPVSGRPITTHVIEAEGWGRIGEWYDYSNETEANFALIVSAPALLEMLERLRNIVTHPNATKAQMRQIAEECAPVIAKAKLAA